MTRNIPIESNSIHLAASKACPDRDTLLKLISETLLPDDQLSAHVDSCSHCQQLLESLSDSGLLNEYRPWISKRAKTLPALDPPHHPNDLGSLGELAILSVLGRGGMGIVFRGYDLRLQREVAVKFVHPGSSPESEKRFAREARAIAAIKHESIVPIYHIGQNSQGQDYIVLPLIQGRSLRACLANQELDPVETARYIQQIADALAIAHSAGLIHRDVKPDNILLDELGQRAKITDFGLVRVAQEAALTQADLLCGTPEYMSPEQATQGDRIDHRSDIYSLGVTLYECLTGTPPFRGRPMEIIDQHRLASPVSPRRLNRSIPTDLETICLKAMNKEVDDRYQTMAELRDDLQRFLDGKPILAKPASSLHVLRLWCRRNPRLALALASTFASLVIGTMVSTIFWLQSSANARQSRSLADELVVNQEQLEVALAASETQRLQAEKRFGELRKLANELVFDIYPQVEYLENSLAARKAIISSALQYLDKLYQESDDDLQLQAELATAYEKIGELLGMTSNTNLGDKDAGLERYQRARLLRQAIYDADPQNPKSIERLAHNFYILGRTLWAKDEIKEAEQAFQTSIQLQRQLVSQQSDRQALNKLATMLIDCAAIPSWDGNYELASQYYEEAEQILDELILKWPEELEYLKTMTRLLRAVSKVESGLGKVADGEASLLKAIEIGKRLTEAYPDDFSVQRSVWISNVLLGEMYILNKVVDKVVLACSAAIEFPKRIVEREPTNALVKLDLAISYFNLARAYRLNVDYSSSIEQAKNALQIMQTLSEAHPNDREYQRNMGIYLTEIARNSLELVQHEEAAKAAAQAIAILRKLMESESGSAYNLFDLSLALRVAAQAHSKLDRNPQALEEVEEAIGLMNQLREAGVPQATEEVLKELNDERESYRQAVNFAPSQ